MEGAPEQDNATRLIFISVMIWMFVFLYTNLIKVRGGLQHTLYSAHTSYMIGYMKHAIGGG